MPARDEVLARRFAAVDRIMVQDARAPKGPENTLLNRNPETVAEAVRLVVELGGEWTRLPPGQKLRGTLAFYYGGPTSWIDVIEVGDRFLRKGGGNFVFTKPIPPELELRLRELGARARASGERVK